ncbi:MAG TPA: M20/M25/M40 family metallo-hydrolase [Gemmatimonadaceae bacterium]|nr:M20/M25/M40 family metallo-hydrolase [Gemmatimonadaceae bacterium]
MPRTSSSHWAIELRAVTLAACCAVALPAIATAQDTSAVGPYARAVSTWISLIASPGSERIATDRIVSATSGFVRDRVGNLIKKVGDGSPRRVLACGLDESGYVVSEITDDGYLRVHMDGNERHVALWDEYHEGQRVIVAALDRAIAGRARDLPGVIAVRSNHLWRHRVADESPTSIENVWVDIGARSRAEAVRMGVDVLDPVVRDWPEWMYADEVAGPAAGNRAGCAAVAAAAQSNNHDASGETDYIISVEKSFDWAGLTSAIARLGRVDSLFIVDATVGGERSAPHAVKAPWAALPALDVGAVLGIGVRTRFHGTLAESIAENDLAALHGAVARAAGLGGETLAAVPVAHGWAAAPPLVVRDSLSRYADMLGKLVDVYAPSGHEQPMRDAIQPLLPAWARDSAVVDTAGNIVLAMGPDRDTTVFVAHMDEIAFEVTRINPDGTVSLRPHGSFFPFLWEGQPALLHRADDKIPPRDGKLGCSASREGPLRGVFTVRDSSTQREPSALTVWFGRSAAELATSGVQPGAMLTGFKCSARLGDTRITGRAIDDRAGDTALLLALEEIDPAKLDHKVIFMWSVREEGGLLGAKAVAAALGPSVHRVHAVDTFVSSDSPLESHRFGYAALGTGAVLRALDNSSVTPPDEIERAVRLARANGIPLQYGVTNGGNDGSEFARWGAIDVALAWPLRYSHSPAEVMDLRDLRSLTRMVAALAKAPTGAVPPAPRRP